MSGVTAPIIVPANDDLAAGGALAEGFEFVNGQMLELNASAKSSWVAGQIYRYLGDYCDAHPGWAFPPGTSFRCFTNNPRTIRRPDAAVIRLDRYTIEQCEREDHISVCPDVVVEVNAPTDLAMRVNRSVLDWLDAGAQLVWVIEPSLPTVYIHRRDGTLTVLRKSDTLTGDPVLPGFAVPVAELFQLPEPART